MSETRHAITVPASADDAAIMQAEAEADLPAILGLAALVTADDYAFADGLLTEVVRRKDAAKGMRTSATGPLYGVIRLIEGWFKPTIDATEKAEAHLKRLMSAYRVRAEAEERENRAAAQLAAKSGDADALLGSLQKAQDALTSHVGTRTTASMVWEVESIDAAELPRAWMMPDAKRLAAFAKAHKGDAPPSIPGVVFARAAKMGARR